MPWRPRSLGRGGMCALASTVLHNKAKLHTCVGPTLRLTYPLHRSFDSLHSDPPLTRTDGVCARPGVLLAPTALANKGNVKQISNSAIRRDDLVQDLFLWGQEREERVLWRNRADKE